MLPDPIMTIPTVNEINVHGSLDEQTACEHFLGKSLEEAKRHFCKDSLTYTEDLMWMGPVAFRYYVKAAMWYIQSEASKADSGMINGFVGVLEFHRHLNPEELRPVAMELSSICNYIIQNYDKFDLDSVFYGDLRSRFIKLTEYFKRF